MVRAVGLVALLASAAACTRQQPAAEPAVSPVERGRYLVVVGGCNDCHTPKVFTAAGPELDTTRLLSGHAAGWKVPPIPAGVISAAGWAALGSGDLTAWAGPWGVSFAANLTPDPSGLGAWTPEMFIQAMRTGKHLGVGRPILPPMPWQDFGQMSDADLRAVFGYLRSVKAVANVVPPPIPPAGSTPPSR